MYAMPGWRGRPGLPPTPRCRHARVERRPPPRWPGAREWSPQLLHRRLAAGQGRLATPQGHVGLPRLRCWPGLAGRAWWRGAAGPATGAPAALERQRLAGPERAHSAAAQGAAVTAKTETKRDQGRAWRSPGNEQGNCAAWRPAAFSGPGPRQTLLGRWRSGDGRFDGQRCRGAVKGGDGLALDGARQPVCQGQQGGCAQHGRVANLAGRAGARVVVCAAVSAGAGMGAGARGVAGQGHCRRSVCGLICMRRVAGVMGVVEVICDAALIASVVLIALIAVIVALRLWGQLRQLRVLRCLGIVLFMCMKMRGGMCVRLARRWRQRHHWRQHARSHGGAHQSSKDQHQHQNEKQAATHAQMIEAVWQRFPAYLRTGALNPSFEQVLHRHVPAGPVVHGQHQVQGHGAGN
jgi:hypothetical protein